MRKSAVALAILLCFFMPAFADEAQDKSLAAFQNDMPKDDVGNIKLMKRIGKVWEQYNEETGSYSPSPEELKKGFTVFTRRYDEYVYPNTLPKKEQVTNILKCSAAPGEYEPVLFLVYPHKDISEITASCPGLISAGNKTIPKENISINYMKYDMEGDFQTMICRNKWLLPGSCNAVAGVPRPFLVTVKIPEEAEAGDYSGKILLNIDGRKEELSLSVEVYPFRLASFGPENLFTYYIYFGYPAEYLEKMCPDLRSHGANMFHMMFRDIFGLKFKDKEVAVDFSKAEKYMPALQKYGFKTIIMEITGIQLAIVDNLKCGFYDDTFNKAYSGALKQLKEKFEKEKWPDLYLYIDEVRDHDTDNFRPLARAYKDVIQMSKLHRDVGLKSLDIFMRDNDGTREDDPKFQANYWELIPLLDGVITHGWMKSKKIVEEAQKQHKMLLFYNCGAARFTMGYLTYILGATGNSQVSYNGPAKVTTSSPYKSNTEGIVAVTPDGPVDTIRFEWMREGIDDYRYIHTLEEIMKQAGGRCPAELAEAESVLAGLKKFKPGDSKASGAESEVLSEQDKALFNGEKMDEDRLKIAKCIIAISEKLK